MVLTKNKKISHSNAKAKALASSNVNSQFNYCAIWMFCSRKTKLRLENIYKRTLLVYNEYEKNYNDLLADHYEISIHRRHLQFLETEVFKSANKFRAL